MKRQSHSKIPEVALTKKRFAWVKSNEQKGTEFGTDRWMIDNSIHLATALVQ
jgi:hypothetical protein